MEIYIYDTDLTLLGVIDEMSSFIWIRRYWKAGEFKLLVPFTDINNSLLQKNRLIMKRGDDEAGQIKYINIRRNIYGMEEIELQGRFITAWLDKRIVLNQISVNDNSQNIINRIVNENVINPANPARKIPTLALEAQQSDLGSGMVNYVSEPFISALLAVERAAMGAKLGMKITADHRAATFAFKQYKGRELTSDQTDNPPCIFSQEFDNVYEQEYTNSTENVRNAAYIGGEERENIDRVIAEYSTESGLGREEIFISAADIARSYMQNGAEVTIPLQQYTQMLIDRGMSGLEQYIEALNFSSKINAFSNLVYKSDYDVGDRVTCLNKRWGIKINARITEIMEAYQQTKTDFFITFGESLPTLFDKLS